eukprot:CAMPEP_0113297746 /NCGR_PEP_ID=MMETSP0010_2-20120614/478_1 /TAXON_ID=216773 ORGANISM="Corethron hystrix, Strain 308" /NCGR_SAMPLE_ID=MMETSP0010_2 /ASSEMBLY_ACC=CAM_ASM_000155 /LENGTH=252 /DNA_ID=CAMNT_0000150683 /DNA_START=82 /DNA_END=840 /DNA_ORIENTATION=- /assembly_acc=CAM_ASM_000155
MTTGATLAVAGDAIVQSRESSYDTRRAASFAMFDSAYRASQHALFPAIISNCRGQYVAGMLSAVSSSDLLDAHPGWIDGFAAMEQTLASQLGIVPFLYYPVFYAVTAVVQGLSFEGAVDRAKETFLPLMKRNLLFWIPVQFVQFGYIEEGLQIPFLSLCGLFWTIILSAFAGSAKEYDENESEAQLQRTEGGSVGCKNGFEEECIILDEGFHAADPSLKIAFNELEEARLALDDIFENDKSQKEQKQKQLIR